MCTGIDPRKYPRPKVYIDLLLPEFLEKEAIVHRLESSEISSDFGMIMKDEGLYRHIAAMEPLMPSAARGILADLTIRFWNRLPTD